MLEANQSASRLHLLSELASEFVTATSDVNRLLALVSRRLAEVIGDSCSLHLVGDDALTFDRHVFYSRDPQLAKAGAEVLEKVPFRVGEGRSGRVAASGEPLLIPITTPSEMASQVSAEFRPLIERLRVHSFMCLPLLVDGRAIGTMTLLRNTPERSFHQDDLRLASDCAAQASLALAIARARESERAARLAAENSLSALRRSEAALRASEAKYRQIVEITVQGVWVVDARSTTRFVNQRMAEMLGYEVDEMLGKLALDHIFDEDRPAFEVRAAQRRAGIVGNIDARLRRKNGSELWVTSTTTPIHNDAGEYQGTVSMLSDITERRRAERELHESNEQLRQAQKMEAVGRLTAGIAHDFNNILSVIISYGELILLDAGAPPSIEGDVQEIVHAAQRAASLTRQLLVFSRQQVVETRVLDLNEVCVGMANILRRTVSEDIEIVALREPDLWKIKADASSMEQVIMNLVVNARDAMPVGGRVTITTSNLVIDEDYARAHVGTRPGPYVALTVSDTGIGMDAATISRIFEPFFSTKEPGKGTGLGLSTVFGITQQALGSIGVESEIGRGTTFRLLFPRTDDEAEVLAVQGAPQLRRGSETILLVEDQVYVRTVALGVLERNGYRVLTATCGEEAMRIASDYSETIHLLLTDLVMPRMSGSEIVKRVRAMRPEIKCLCMSGYDQSKVLYPGIAAKDIGYLQKPFTADLLGRRVRELLDA